jgi:tetratricopeptide (TPR) repeat protein
MSLDWDRLTDQDFEELCYDFLSRNGFENIEYLGRGGNDRGRDILCTKSEIPFENFRKTTTYLVQCKKWISRPPGPSDLNHTIAWADAHKPNALIIMVSTTLTSSSKDWLKDIGKSKSYAIYLYEELNFKNFLERNKDIFEKYFGARKSKLDDSNIELKKRLLLALAREGNLTVNQASEVTSISKTRVRSYLKKLVTGGLVSLKAKRYSLTSTRKAFLKVAEQLLSFDYGFAFVTSQYADSSIDQKLVSYIESRYFLRLGKENKDNLLIMIRLAPTALHHALFGSNISYKNGHTHLKSLKLREPEKTKWADSFSHQFILEMLRKLLTDLANPDCAKALKKEKVDGYYMKIEIRMANAEQPIFNTKSESGVMLHKAKGKINVGELLSVTDPDVYIKTADVLSNLGLNEQAIEKYDLAINQVKDTEKLKAAYNNKGVVLMRLGNPSGAIRCFDEALKIDPDLRQATENKKECLDKLGLKLAANSAHIKT